MLGQIKPMGFEHDLCCCAFVASLKHVSRTIEPHVVSSLLLALIPHIASWLKVFIVNPPVVHDDVHRVAVPGLSLGMHSAMKAASNLGRAGICSNTWMHHVHCAGSETPAIFAAPQTDMRKKKGGPPTCLWGKVRASG